MKITVCKYLFALLFMCFLIFGIVYPYLTGGYDPFSLNFSITIQIFSLFSILPAAAGLCWIIGEIINIFRKKTTKNFIFSIIVFVASMLAVFLSIILCLAEMGILFAILLLFVCIIGFINIIPKIMALKNKNEQQFIHLPIIITMIPIVILFFQIEFGDFFIEYSRNRAIIGANVMIIEIEDYKEKNGQYPESLFAVHNDYKTFVVGIERYYYVKDGDTYNLIFKQPRFLLKEIGTKEFVVYNPKDDHMMISHDGWLLYFNPEQMKMNQGWYAKYDMKYKHWKYFWFD
jgi:hypothetical protein